MRLIKWIFLLAGCSVLSGACGKSNDNPNEPELTTTVKLSTPAVSDITSDQASLSASLSTNNASVILKKGFCYATQANVDISDKTVEMNNAGSTLSCVLSGLQAETTYYIKAFVTVSGSEPVYSKEISFATTARSANAELDNYTPPTYADNYVSLADWSNRSQWNLTNVHDPSVVLAEDGYYYMYQTDASYGNAHTAGGHFHGRRSKDLVNWEYLGGTMQSLPTWVIPKLNELRKAMGLANASPNENDFGYWAPCVRKVRNGLYRMYYSIVVPGTINGTGSWSERAFIGLMENSNPANNDGWVDKGYVITNASDKGLNYMVSPTDYANCYFKWNAIDPSYIIDKDGKHYLIYGSWHSGIAALELNADSGKPQNALPQPWGTDNDILPYGKLLVSRQLGNRWQGSEGPEIIYNPSTGYYYLFLAYDALGVPYNTRVCRSTNIYGPYMGIDGTNLTQNGGEMLPVVTHPYKFSNNDGWVGISHCAIFEDGKGNWYYASQGRFPENVGGNPYSNAIMMGHVRKIHWTNSGWPVVMPERYGAVPEVAITEAELIGKWEHIDLSYSYGKQKASSTMTLGANHSITEGTWKGKSWSYDPVKQVLTVNGIELLLQREVDWEATPRTHTIVYAGYTETKTYWGKKSK